MARNRIIYQSEALFVSKTGKTAHSDIKQLQRIQSINYSFDITRTDINQFGQLARIDAIITEAPTVSLDYSYYCQTGENEVNIGLDVGFIDAAAGEGGADDVTRGSCISGILQASSLGAARQDMNTYYIATHPQGEDAVGNTIEATSVISIGNAFLTSYSANGSVGDFVTADVNAEGLNMMFESGSAGTVNDPTLNEANGTLLVSPPGGGTVTLPVAIAGTGDSSDDSSYTSANDGDVPIALRHGDIDLTLGNPALGYNLGGAEVNAQNFTFSFDLSRTNLEKLGSRFAYSKEIEFPLSASLDVSFIIGDIDNSNGNDANLDALENVLNDSGGDPEFECKIRCFGNGQSDGTSADDSADGLGFKIKGAKLDSQGFSSSIGDNKTMDISASAQIGGPSDLAHGIEIDHLGD